MYKITIDRDELERIVVNAYSIFSQTVATQTVIDNIKIDKDRYKNVDIKYRDVSIAYDLVGNIGVVAERIAADILALMEEEEKKGGGKWANSQKKCGAAVCVKKLITLNR